MIKCDFCVHGGDCSASPYRSRDAVWGNYSSYNCCYEATRNFTNYMIEKERSRNTRTFNKNVNVKKNNHSHNNNRNYNKNR